MKSDSEIINDYPNQVGDIAFDPEQDDPNFRICVPERILQYYEFSSGLMYSGEKVAISDYFRKEYKNKNYKYATGFVTVRFIVNCEGKLGRLRAQCTDEQFREVTFDKDLILQLLELTKKLNQWGIPSDGHREYDYYQYLTFKLESGNLLEVLP